jgi:hypothetical protein
MGIGAGCRTVMASVDGCIIRYYRARARGWSNKTSPLFALAQRQTEP